MWKGCAYVSCPEREGTGNAVKNRAVDIRGSIQGARGGSGKGRLDEKDGAARAGRQRVRAARCVGRREAGWPRTVTEGNRQASDGQGA